MNITNTKQLVIGVVGLKDEEARYTTNKITIPIADGYAISEFATELTMSEWEQYILIINEKIAEAEEAGKQGLLDMTVSAQQSNNVYVNKTINDEGIINLDFGIPVSTDSGSVEYVLPIATDITLGGVKVGHALQITTDGTLSVDTVDDVEEDNTKPITSKGVYTTVGNINALLASI